MRMLAVDWTNREIYVGDLGNLRHVENPGVLFPIRVFDSTADIYGPDSEDFSNALVFQELSFEPTSGIRRGYFLKGNGSQGRHIELIRGSEKLKAQIDLYYYSSLNVAFQSGVIPADVIFTFGSSENYTVGELVQVEKEIRGRYLMTIRMRRQFGMWPKIYADQIPQASQHEIVEHLEKVMGGFRSSPAESVVDRCREAVTAILSAYLGEKGKDLGNLIQSYEGPNRERRDTTSNLAQVIGRLHSRGKFSERSRLDLPPINEREAELCIGAVGLILVNLKWARWH